MDMNYRTANGLGEAVNILQTEAHDGFHLHVYLNIAHISVELAWLHVFLPELQENRRISMLGLYWGVLDHRNDSVHRLFAEVLAEHLSLTRVAFRRCRLAPECVDLLADSLAENSSIMPQRVRFLDLEGTRLDHQGRAAIANLLRMNTRLAALNLDDCDVMSDGCSALFDALNGNTHLVELQLRSNSIFSFSLTGVQALANSVLRKLNLNYNGLTTESVRTLTEGLITNGSLRQICINSNYEYPISSFDLIEEHLDRFNFALRAVEMPGNQERIDYLLRINNYVREAHSSLQSHDYRVPLLSLWPYAIGRISSKSSLLYLFVRRGNVDAFTNHVAGGRR